MSSGTIFSGTSLIRPAHHLVLLFCLTANAAFSQAHPALSPQDAQTLRQAVSLYEAGNSTGAAPLLTRLATRYPANAQVQTAAGMSLLESGNLAAGVPFLVQAHRLTPADPAVTRNLAVAYVQLDQPLRAIPLLQKLTVSAPRDATVWLPLAQAYRAANQPQSAIATYEHTATLLEATAPAQLPNLYYDWAATLLAANQPQPALNVLGRIPPASLDATALALRADANEKAAHYEAAVTDYRRAAELQPTEPNIQAYGEELLRHWTFPAAATIFDYALKQYPQSQRLQRDLGIAYYGNNDYLHASEIFGTLLTQQPDSNATADLLGRSCSALGTQSAAACDKLRPFALAHPANAPAALYAAIIILQQPASDANYTQAAQLLENSVKADPTLATAWYQTGVLQQARNDWPASATSLEKAVALRPAYPEAHYRLSRAYSHLNKPDQAREQMALQKTSADAAKQLEASRLEGVLTFVTDTH